MPVGIHAQQDALLQQHPHGILTDHHGGRRAGQHHPSGHHQPRGNRGSINPRRARGRLGHCGVALWEVAPLQASHHDQGHQHQHHASGDRPSVASCCVHADSRSRVQPFGRLSTWRVHRT
jgi:hypothetical protein